MINQYEVYVFDKKTNTLLCQFYAAYQNNIKDISEQLSFIPEIIKNETTTILIKKTRSQIAKDLEKAYKKLEK